jgi:tetratricopeptide (TPR) repeat protein
MQKARLKAFGNTISVAILFLFICSFANHLHAQTDACREPDPVSQIGIYTARIAANPDDYWAYVLRGREYFYAKHSVALAFADINNALQLRPKSPQVLVERGWLLSQMGRYKEAVSDLSMAIELDGQNHTALYYRGRAYAFWGSPLPAIQDFEKAISLQERNYYAMNGLALELHKIGYDSTAYGWWNQSLEILNQEIDAADASKCSFHLVFTRATILSSVKRYKEALYNFGRALEMKPTNFEAHYYRAITYYDLEDYKVAVSEFTKSIRLNPNFAPSYSWRANTFRKLKDIKAAEADEKRNLALSNPSPSVVTPAP